MSRRMLAWLGISCLAAAPAAAQPSDPPPAPVGVAVVDITPDYPIRLNGYGNRKTESEGVETRLKAKALAIGDEAGGPAVLVAVDNCGVPGRVTDEVAARLKAKAGLPRERFTVCSTHTHCAPVLTAGIPFIFGGPIPPEQSERIDRYTHELTDAIERVALAALADRKPSRLAWAQGQVGFAMNRRPQKQGKVTAIGVNPRGPVDHSLPVLRATDPDGKVRAVLFNYACHCTTLSGNYNKLNGDWATYACDEIERANPGAVALAIIGCGADANPEPRRGVDDARAHGAAIGSEVARLMKGTWKPLPGRVAAAFRTIEVPFGTLPTREQLAERANKPGAEGYFARTMLERLDRGESLPKTLTYPVQTWAFGDALAVVFLGGEVVVDYALRLKKECDAERLWVVAYSNDVPCYIASRRVIGEGGYEVDGSMVYYGRPTRLAPEAEDRIVEAVHDLLPDAFETPKAKP